MQTLNRRKKMNAVINIYGTIVVQADTETELFALKRWWNEFNASEKKGEMIQVCARVKGNAE